MFFTPDHSAFNHSLRMSKDNDAFCCLTFITHQVHFPLSSLSPLSSIIQINTEISSLFSGKGAINFPLPHEYVIHILACICPPIPKNWFGVYVLLILCNSASQREKDTKVSPRLPEAHTIFEWNRTDKELQVLTIIYVFIQYLLYYQHTRETELCNTWFLLPLRGQSSGNAGVLTNHSNTSIRTEYLHFKLQKVITKTSHYIIFLIIQYI